jgi:CHAD domain-containing protein
MEIKREKAQRPLRKLRRTLKRLPKDPATKDVHALRTETRRLEAILEAFMLDSKKRTRNLLKSVTPVRKAAGDVRDMDVLVDHLRSLSRGDEDDSLIRLVEHLKQRRVASARGLKQTVDRKGKTARRDLKQYSRLIGKQFRGKSGSTKTKAPALVRLATELADWPALNTENIHPFRIKVKQLRYMLQLCESDDKDMVNALGKVKDQIGDWHDWQELARLARETLDQKKDRAALKQIEDTGLRKFKKALTTANELRSLYFTKKPRAISITKRARKQKKAK